MSSNSSSQDETLRKATLEDAEQPETRSGADSKHREDCMTRYLLNALKQDVSWNS